MSWKHLCSSYSRVLLQTLTCTLVKKPDTRLWFDSLMLIDYGKAAKWRNEKTFHGRGYPTHSPPADIGISFRKIIHHYCPIKESWGSHLLLVGLLPKICGHVCFGLHHQSLHSALRPYNLWLPLSQLHPGMIGAATSFLAIFHTTFSAQTALRVTCVRWDYG